MSDVHEIIETQQHLELSEQQLVVGTFLKTALFGPIEQLITAIVATGEPRAYMYAIEGEDHQDAFIKPSFTYKTAYAWRLWGVLSSYDEQEYFLLEDGRLMHRHTCEECGAMLYALLGPDSVERMSPMYSSFSGASVIKTYESLRFLARSTKYPGTRKLFPRMPRRMKRLLLTMREVA